MDIYDTLMALGAIGIILLVIFIILLPATCAIIIATWVASILHLTGIVWWAFLILFVWITLALLTFLTKDK